MLSLKHGLPIADIRYKDTDEKKKPKDLHKVNLLEDDEDEPAEISTTPQNLLRIFKAHVSLDKKLTQKDINMMVDAFEHGKNLDDDKRLSRKFDQAKVVVQKSLKKYLDFDKSAELFTIIPEWSRTYCTGGSGSGKSYTISRLVQRTPAQKGGACLLFSPIHDDKELSKIKNLIQIDFQDFYTTNEREFDYNDIPHGSICIFDDYLSFPKDVVKMYQDLLDKVLDVGRHKHLSVYVVSHASLNGRQSKSSIREAQFLCLFPKINPRDTKVILAAYAGLDKTQIDEIMSLKTRWCIVHKTHPKYLVSERNVIVY